MTGKTQAEAVTILRNIPLGNAVQLIVSRQEMEDSEQTENENESVSSNILFYFLLNFVLIFLFYFYQFHLLSVLKKLSGY